MTGQIFSIERIRAAALEAFRRNAGLSANPYPEGSEAHLIWESAYIRASNATFSLAA